MLSVRWKKHLPKLIGVVVIAGVAIGVTWVISAFMDKEPGSPKKVVRQITLLTPPPPPPPPPKIEQPPEPKMEEEIDVPEPEMAEELPDVMDEVPAGDQLGLDADGGAGDSFGLIGKKGGRNLLSGAGDPFVMFASQLQRQIEDALLESDKTRKQAYSVVARVWVADDGSVIKAELATSTGVADIDRSILDVIHAVPSGTGQMPEGMQQPIRFRITSRM